ncbi:hypothetical protein [Argonema galeatum]|uniref:hypothetical protein n=1 Tax=Argonema galeatum TaxID=2942762 RepID=UPI0020137CFA|nr:hypothetical protein [Argonema galeatum]MCL1467458.1 hypothetical protein [Argonema galeatum A003/A1]
MPLMTDRTLEVVIDDLNILILEIEANPGTSSWTIRMALKAIVDKANKIEKETA